MYLCLIPFACIPLSRSACAKDLGTSKGLFLPFQPMNYRVKKYFGHYWKQTGPSGYVPKQSGKG